MFAITYRLAWDILNLEYLLSILGRLTNRFFVQLIKCVKFDMLKESTVYLSVHHLLGVLCFRWQRLSLENCLSIGWRLLEVVNCCVLEGSAVKYYRF